MYEGNYILTRQQVEAILALLSAYGLQPTQHAGFMRYMMEDPGAGLLEHTLKPIEGSNVTGYGWKIKFNGRRVYVTLYSEQETPERERIRDEINKDLLNVWKIS